MEITLIEVWRDQASVIEAKSFRQIIQLAGDGRLRDGNGTSSPPSPAGKDDVRHWHVYFNDYGNRVELMKASGGVLLDLAPFVVSVGDEPHG